MVKSFTSVFLAFSFLAAAFVMPVSAQTDQMKRVDERIQKFRDLAKSVGTGEAARVKVGLFSGTSYTGFIREMNQDDFVLVDKKGLATTIKFSDVKDMRKRNKGSSLGAGLAIGIAAGVAAGFFLFYAYLRARS